MKKILSIFILLGFVIFNACDPMEDIYTEIDAQDDPIVTAIEQTLSADDYKTIASLAVKANAADTINADFLTAYKYFTSDISFQDYIAMYLNDRYQAQGAGSTAKITYNYSEEIPADLAMYADAIEYEFTEDDYNDISSLVGEVGYFFPNYNPDLYLKEVLGDLIPDAENGDIYRINYTYSNVNPVVPETAPVEVYVEPFTADLSGVDTVSIIGAQKWGFSTYGGATYAKMSGYSSGAKENEDWLVTPNVTLSTGLNIFLNVYQAINYLNDSTYQLDVLVSTDYTGDVTTANWSSVKADMNMPSGNSWTFVESVVSLNDYEGQTINVAFKYTSSLNNAATWEIANISITEGDKILEGDSYALNDMYEFDNGVWNKMEDIYYLNPSDYFAMGSSYTSFSSSAAPQDYIPKWLDATYPAAGEGISAIVIYEYYTGTSAGTVTIADEYTYTSGEWVSSYAYVQEMTAQWAVSSSTNKWVFDPTETLVMTNAEYKYIVDYVIANFDAAFVGYDSRREFYYGVSEKYNNFDLTADKYNADEFESWDDAVKHALADVLLPYLYPNATLQVNGVDMYYKVVFNTYSGSNALYVMKFQVTKAGPDPEFTLVEGPTLF